MKRHLGITPCILVTVALAIPARAEEVVLNALYKSLAERNHYPAAEGLVDARADVKCNILDQVVAAFPGVDAGPVSVTYSWSRPDPEGWPTKGFSVKGIPADQTDLAKRANMIFSGQGQEDLVIEAPVYWTIATTEATAVNDGGTIKVTGLARSSSDPIKKLTVEIETGTYKVRKIVMDLGAEQATIELTSKEVGGKWGVASSVLTRAQFKRVMNYEYTQIGEIWLPSKISVDYQGLDGTALEPTYIYEFANWKVDRRAPEPTARQSEREAEDASS